MALPPTTAWATTAFQPGDVVLFGAQTIHCAWSNVSPDRVRAAFDLRYEPASDGESSELRPIPF
jgi:ectoine hydroxylase-related dioxygenase (phytanoyl-CoA dioxygenase family)